MIVLFESAGHRNVMFHEFSSGEMIQANQHVIVDGQEGMLLDPGGHKVYPQLFAELSSILPPHQLKHILFSHQDPDIVAAANGWLMVTDAKGYVSSLWTRFVPHFGLDDLVTERLVPVADEGMRLKVGGCEVKLLPAHYLHSPGNLQVYDPVSRILYSGDLGASVGAPSPFVEDFAKHVPFMEGFHRRYMASRKAMQAWARMARKLDVQMVAPQHGSIFRGPDMVKRFVDWVEALDCGVDLLQDFNIP